MTGTIPVELANISTLIDFRLDANYLEGIIHPEFGDFKLLQWFRLEDNYLTGTIPPQLGQLGSSIRYFNIGKVCISGSIKFEPIESLCQTL